MDITKETKNRALKRAEELGLGIVDLHKKIGTSYSTLWNFLKGNTTNFSKISELAGELQVSLDWLLNGESAPHSMQYKKSMLNLKNVGSIEETQFGPDMIPILGYANASSEAVLLNYDEPIGKALRHPNLKDVKNAFWLCIHDESMVPRYYPGELAAVAGDRRPLPKRDCVVEMNNGEVYVKQFVRMNDKEIICKQLNPSKEWKKPRSEVKSIHAIVGRGEK